MKTNIMALKKLIFIGSFALLMVFGINDTSIAQDPEFTQFYANQLYLNPAFAGTARCPRLTLNYRNQWPNLSGSYVTTTASYDQHVNAIQGGLGLIIMSDNAGQGILKTTSVSGMYSYQQTITRKFSIRAGLEATYMQKSLDWSKLTFGDQIDARHGFIYETKDIPRGGQANFVDFSAGVLGFSKQYFFGFAVHHLTEPNESLVLGKSALPMKWTGHIGAVIPIERGKRFSDASISPNILYRRQGEYQQLNTGLYFKKGPLVAGVWYRGLFFNFNNNDEIDGNPYKDALILTIGVQSEVIKFGYSYDITISQLTPGGTGGSHEVSMTIQFDCKRKKTRLRTISCPSF